MAMTPEAKRALSATIRSLRVRLLIDLHASAETAYRLSIRARDAGLDEAGRTRRARLEAWMAEQVRAQDSGGGKGGRQRTAADFRLEAEKQAAYTLLNRMVLLRLMEAPGPNGEPLREPAVVKGGWESPAYTQFRAVAKALVHDDTEGYAFLLQLVFEDLATDLPGLFGPAGVADLIPVPAATLRHLVEALNDAALDTCWTDDMTLGWVYQYWNDPEREEIDAKLHGGGKVEPHEIASKTQMFTERYMVDWLLQNSLGPMWLAMCRKHGWTADIEAPDASGKSPLDHLEDRRVAWRARRDAGEVSLTELMPLHTELERRWAYYVPQPIPDDAVTQAPESVRGLKILDPAVGSGHFLVVAMDLLVALYREEARHRGLAGDPQWTDQAIVECILGHNLHGIDLDPRAVQIAAAALWVKARHIAPAARPEQLNLVASNLRLSSLADDDPALAELRQEVEQETGIPGALTDTIVHALRGADHLGSLLKVDRAVDEAIEAHERTVAVPVDPQQPDIFEGPDALASPKPADKGAGDRGPQTRIAFEATAARRSLLDRLETFLSCHTGGDDLGLRLRGEQLAAGVRFVRMTREGTCDLVVANPPYQGTSKMRDAAYVESVYPLGKADLYAAFLLRGLELVRPGGVSAMLTMRNWMFIKQSSKLRAHLLNDHALRALGDFDRGAFEDVPDEVVSVVVSVFGKECRGAAGVALCPTPRDDRSRDSERTLRKRAATLSHTGKHDFATAEVKAVPEWPLVYWWNDSLRATYAGAAKLGDVAPGKFGINTGNNVRFLRRRWEVLERAIPSVSTSTDCLPMRADWQRYLKGAEGRVWADPCDDIVGWSSNGLEVKTYAELLYGSHSRQIRNESAYFRPGVAFTMLGTSFSARMHRWRCIIDSKGSSVYPESLPDVLCAMNRKLARDVLCDLNPSLSFQVGDVNRLPLIHVESASRILEQGLHAFATHESHREPSAEYRLPGPSPWRSAQAWAQAAVDRAEDAPLSPYEPEYDAELPTDYLSFALGVALGRFGPNGEGILDPTSNDLSHALPAGILFLDGTLEDHDTRDGLVHPAAAPLHRAWAEYGPAISSSRSGLREWLALDFLKGVHKSMYENRPIHWPLSSADKTFVAWVNIHRFTDRTLRVLLADHLQPALTRLEGELSDLRAARDGADRKAARKAEKRYDTVLSAKDELVDFMAKVEQCADRGAPPTDANCPPREQDARYAPDLDDGVMINSAALWPLLEPQWRDPKKWWKELSEAKGRKDYDWSHLAMRYWPTRVDEKCRKDPSLGVAHGCFWRYHPERAWAWELRLQDEIGPDFRIEEPPYRPGGRDVGDAGDGPHRTAWLRDHAKEALAVVEHEAARRIRKAKTRGVPFEMRILETGLWSAIPDEVWEMELRLAKKQGAEVTLLAPDEPPSRAAFKAAHPDKVEERAALLADLVRDALFEEPDDEDAPLEDDEAENDSSDDIEEESVP